jgi:methionine-rich copper-binding protein CopC
MMAKVIRGSNRAFRGRGAMSRTARWGKKFGTLGVLSLAFVVLGAAAPSTTTLERPALPPHAVSSATVTPHITLEASFPEDDQTVDGGVTEVRLFFSDAPLMRGASIRVVNSSRRLVRSSPPEADANDPKQLSVQLDPALPAGRYVVQWRCIADDGHVMRGDFTFEVAGP